MAIGFTLILTLTAACFITSLIRNATLRKICSSLSGLVLGYYVFGFGYTVVVICFLMAYVPILLLPRL